jgi:hypothetical protein
MVVVETNAFGETMCGYRFEAKKSYIVIADGGGSRPFSTSLCKGNRRLHDSRAWERTATRAEIDSLNVIAKWSRSRDAEP